MQRGASHGQAFRGRAADGRQPFAVFLCGPQQERDPRGVRGQ
jgi:hypothetical protein